MTVSSSLYLGVDVSKATLHACVLSDSHPRQRQFPNSLAGFRHLLAWLKLPPGHLLHLAVEATGRYHVALADWAHQQGATIYVLNPTRLKHYAQSQPRRSKTDQADAYLIAHDLQRHVEQLRAYQPASAAVKQLRELARRREQIVKMLKQEKVRASDGSQDELVQQSVGNILEMLGAELKRVEALIETTIKEDEELKANHRRLKSVPQVGKVLAMLLLAELGDGSQFERGKDVTAWLGLAPLEKQSGTSVRQGAHISRGNAALRKALYMAAFGAMGNSTWESWSGPQKKRGKEGRKLMVALMDKLVRVCWGVLKTRQPFAPEKAFHA